MDLPKSVSAPTAAVRDAATLLRRNPVLFGGGLVFGFAFLLMPKLGRGLFLIVYDLVVSEETHLALAHSPGYLWDLLVVLGTVPYLALFPFVVAGLVGMIHAARTERVTMADFVPAGKSSFGAMLEGASVNYVILIAFPILHSAGEWLFRMNEAEFVVTQASIPFRFSYWMTTLAGANFPLQVWWGTHGGQSLTEIELVIESVVWALEFLLLIMLFLIQLYPVAVVVEGRTGLQGVRRSAELVRTNLLSTCVYLGYSLIFVLAGVVTAGGIVILGDPYLEPVLEASAGIKYDLSDHRVMNLTSYLEYGYLSLLVAALATVQYTYATAFFAHLAEQTPAEQ